MASLSEPGLEAGPGLPSGRHNPTPRPGRKGGVCRHGNLLRGCGGEARPPSANKGRRVSPGRAAGVRSPPLDQPPPRHKQKLPRLRTKPRAPQPARETHRTAGTPAEARTRAAAGGDTGVLTLSLPGRHRLPDGKLRLGMARDLAEVVQGWPARLGLGSRHGPGSLAGCTRPVLR